MYTLSKLSENECFSEYLQTWFLGLMTKLCCSAVTENTRASYPIHFIDNARIPCVGPHPKNLILLCCDAFGVLPPISRLTKEQAMYHFISGYTAKVLPRSCGV